MSARDIVEPAFPVPVSSESQPYFMGMSLRDYFAAKVLAALVASEPDEACISTTGDGIAQEQAAYRERQARFAYLYADAMIAERAK